jgi:Na+-driven multidrug efflux pump
MAALIATGISVFFSILIWFWAEPMFRFFTPQPDVVGVASAFLRINIISYVVWGVVVALSMCLNGVGDTAVAMVTNLVSMVVIQLGLAYYLSNYTSLGVYGIRWAVVSGIVARGIIYTIYFKQGRWLHKKV